LYINKSLSIIEYDAVSKLSYKKGQNMDKFVKKLVKNHLGAFMDKSVDALALADEDYKNDLADSEELEKRYESLNLEDKDRIVINDYIACLMTREHKMRDIAYLAGVADSIKLFNELGAIKDLGA
jgi:hypothetical protein